MQSKGVRKTNSEKSLFKSEYRSLPKINLLTVDTQQTINNSFDLSQDLKKTQDLIDTFGLLRLSPSPCISPSSSCNKYKSAKINFSDLMGERNVKKIVSKKKLFPIKRNLKKKAFIDQLKEKRSLFRPTTPNIMDQNTNLRLRLDDMRQHVRSKERMRTAAVSLSPTPHQRRNRVVTVILC
jgi:hypothetical protein